jgi:tetratricopeptide (TPR) repeat protein
LGGFLHSLGFGGKYARGTNRSASGPVPRDPNEAARYFQPLPVEQEEYELTSSEARKIRQNRMLRSRSIRAFNAFFWVMGRKISRLHRAFPIWLVAIFYLTLAGGLCFFLMQPLLTHQAVAVTPLPERTVPKQSLPDAINAVSQLISEKNFAQAKEDVDKLLIAYPNDPRILMTKGAIFAGERNYPDALASFQQALDLAPDSAPAMMNLAEIEFVMGKYAEAEAHYIKLVPSQPKNPLLVLRLYLCAKLQKDPEAAAKYLRSPAIGAQSLEWYYMNAAEALFAGNNTEGMKTIEKARLLFGEKTRPYDKTLSRLGLIPETPGN